MIESLIRKAEEKDFLSIIHLGETFWQETEFTEPYDPSSAFKMIKLSYDHGLLAVVEVDDKIVGFVAGVSSPLLGNNAVRAAAELAYFILPEYRGRGLKLLRFYEELVKEQGIKYNSMMSLQSCNPDKANRVYEAMGYHLSEMTFLKVM